MTTSQSASKSERPPRKWLIWSAHHPVTIAVAWALTSLTMSFWSWIEGSDDWWPLSLFPIWYVLMSVPLLATREHFKILLCDWCHAKIPLDPQQAVKDRLDRLVLMHRASDRPWRYIVWVIFLISMIIIPRGVPLLLIMTIFLGYAVGVSVLGKTHTLLQPWCPLCHDDDGPDDVEVEPIPEPDPDMTKKPEPVTVNLR